MPSGCASRPVGGVARPGRSFPVEMSVSPGGRATRWSFNAFVHDISERRRTDGAHCGGRGALPPGLRGQPRRHGAPLARRPASCASTAPSASSLGYPVRRAARQAVPRDHTSRRHRAGRRGAARDRGRASATATGPRSAACTPKGHHLWIASTSRRSTTSRGAVLHLIAQIEDITERKEHEERLTHQALHDPLTGLPNRIAVRGPRPRGARRAASAGAFAVIYLDLDTFKPINDTLGHAAGDEVLVEVARRLEGCCARATRSRAWAATSSRSCCEGIDEAGGAAGRRARDRRRSRSRSRSATARSTRRPASGSRSSRATAARWTPRQVLRGADLAMYRPRRRASPATRCSRAGWATSRPDRAGWRGELRRGARRAAS